MSLSHCINFLHRAYIEPTLSLQGQVVAKKERMVSETHTLQNRLINDPSEQTLCIVKLDQGERDSRVKYYAHVAIHRAHVQCTSTSTKLHCR